MPRSMTGFSRLAVQTKEGQFVGEIASLNKKFFEVSLFLPKEFFRYEMDLRKKISEEISRGQVSLRIFFFPHKPELLSFLPETGFLKTLKKGWEERARLLGLDKKSVDLFFLAQQAKEVSFPESVSEDEQVKKNLFSFVDRLIDALVAMKEKEGALLLKDIKTRLKKCEKWIDEIEKLSKTSVSQYREKLLQRVGEYFTKPSDEERLLKEVVLFAEKIDITEEIVRFRSHLSQVEALFKVKEQPIGRKLEFFLQEFHREINTIGSKTSDALVSRRSIEIKSELEKIREQVQNIE